MSPDFAHLLQYLNKHFDAMEQRFVLLEERLDELRARVAVLQTSVDVHTERLGFKLEY